VNTDTIKFRPLSPDEEPTDDEVLVVGTPPQMRRLARNLAAMKRKARKASRASRKKNR